MKATSLYRSTSSHISAKKLLRSLLQLQSMDNPSCTCHLSGWELYARETVVLSEQRTQLPRPAQRRIKIAYHVTAIAVGVTLPAIVQEHFGRLIFSGLYDVVERIYCFILGPSDC